jgi:hypothetical protein
MIVATDASDTMDMAAMLIAARCQRTGMQMGGSIARVPRNGF